MKKIAQVNCLFWIMKICATTLGETAGDLLSMTMNIGYAVSSLILIALFVASLVAQLGASKFHPTLFWTVILTTSTAGTTMSDFMDGSLGLGYAKGSLILVTSLIAVLAVWYSCEKSLSLGSIQTRKAEMFYWTDYERMVKRRIFDQPEIFGTRSTNSTRRSSVTCATRLQPIALAASRLRVRPIPRCAPESWRDGSLWNSGSNH